MEVSRDDPVVDDVRIEVREVEVSAGLDDQQRDDDGDLGRVRANEGAQQTSQHGRPSRVSTRNPVIGATSTAVAADSLIAGRSV